MMLAIAFTIAANVTSAGLAGGFANLDLALAQRSAAERSPDVAGAGARVREFAAALSAARGTFGPAISANYAQSPQAGAMGGTVEQRLTTLGGQVTIGDLLAYSPAVTQAAANLRGAQFDLISAGRNESVRLISLYYDALRAVATAQTRSDALTAAREDQRAAAIRFRAGDAPRLDVVRASVALARASAAYELSAAQRANALEALGIETGRDPSSFGDAQTEPETQNIPGPSVQEAVRSALLHRPEIASAQAAVDAESAAVHSAQRSILPTITIASGYARGVDSGINVAGPSASAQLTFPLSNASSERAAEERARLQEAQAHLAAVQREVTVEVGAAMRTFLADSRALSASREARQQAQAELDAVTVGYRSGASSSLEVTAARQTYVQAALDLSNAEYAHAQARATLELLIGK